MAKLSGDQLAWLFVVLCVILSTAADTVSTIMWERKSRSYLVVMLVLAPMVFATFGYIGSHFGLSIASSLTNSLIVIGPITIGLIFREEWKNMPWQVYVGMAMIVIGITIVVVFRPEKPIIT
jgi:hypothetical protein